MRSWRLFPRYSRPSAAAPGIVAVADAPDSDDTGRERPDYLPVVIPAGSPAPAAIDHEQALPLDLELEDGLTVQVRLTDQNAGAAVHATQQLLDESRRSRQAAEPEASWIGLG